MFNTNTSSCSAPGAKVDPSAPTGCYSKDTYKVSIKNLVPKNVRKTVRGRGEGGAELWDKGAMGANWRRGGHGC